MTSLLRARQRADEFQALISGSSDPARSRADLTALVGVATALREHTPATPRPDFAASLREQLLVEAATVLTGEAKSLALPVRRRGARERRLVAAATAVVLMGGTAGMAAAAQSALPGDALYTIKRTLERAQAGLNTNDQGKGHDLLAQANDRLQEVKGLLAQDSRLASPEVPATIDDFSSQAQEGAGLLFEAFEADRDASVITELRTFAAESLAMLQDLARTAPPAAQVALANAARVLQDLDNQALAICSVCADDLPPLQIKELLLSSAAASEVETALAKAAEGLGKDASATGGGQAASEAPTTQTQKPSKTDAPATTTDPSATVDNTKKGVKSTVDNTVDPVEELVDQLLPGVGGLLGDTFDGLSEGLLGSN
ncbi:MAG TPA: DUF5667 domain-containing protein [Nocardioidaceae bacterium]|nr:DUF5667 domain-containing protein [Nocardioidaceae bacterium]